LIHLSVQKKHLSPLPIITLEAALKIYLTFSSTGLARVHHGFLSSARRFQAQRTLKVVCMISKFKMPSPPRGLGWHSVFQFTKHLPPFTASVPFYKKALLILSIALNTHGGGSSDSKWKMAIALKTNSTRMSLPPCVSIKVF
jgi:hypothetical protein